MPWTLAGLLIAASALSGLRIIGPTERGVVQRFGRALEVQLPPGIHLLWPMGIDRVTRVEMRRTRRVMIGIEAADRAMGNLPNPEISQFLTGDRNIVDVQLSVQYILADPRLVLFAVDGVERAVANACESALNASASSLSVDDVLTRRRADIQRHVQAAAQSRLDEHGVGVQLLTATLERTAPPEAVADAFRAVTGARADRDRMVAEAQGYGEDLLPRTRGEAAGMLAAAAADAYAAETLAAAEVRRFAALSTQAARNPALVRRQLHLDAMEAVLGRTRTILVDPQQSGPVRIIEEAP